MKKHQILVLFFFIFCSVQSAWSADFDSGEKFDRSDFDRASDAEDRRRKIKRKEQVEEDDAAREAADAARQQAHMQPVIRDDKSRGLQSVKSSIFDTDDARYSVDLSDGVRRGRDAAHRNLPSAPLTDITKMSDGAFGDDTKDLDHDSAAKDKARHNRARLPDAFDYDDSYTLDDKRRDREWRALITPKDLIGDWVPRKADREDNGGFTKPEYNGAPVPYNLNGHPELQRGFPWAINN